MIRIYRADGEFPPVEIVNVVTTVEAGNGDDTRIVSLSIIQSKPLLY